MKDISKGGDAKTYHHTPETFWARVDKTGDCWLWTLSTTGFGYGALMYQGKSNRAHRLAYQLSKGPIPKGLQVLHKCDNPLCCNPDHLFLGTHKDNINDRISKGRTAKGEAQGAHKLTSEQVIYIRSFSKPVPIKKISEELGVHRNTVYRAYKGIEWGHI